MSLCSHNIRLRLYLAARRRQQRNDPPPRHLATPPSVRTFLPSLPLSLLYSPPPAENSSTNGLCMPPPPHSLSPFLSEFLVYPAANAAAIQVIHPSMGWLPGGGLCAGIVARGSHVVKDISQSMPDLHFVLAPVSCNKKSD